MEKLLCINNLQTNPYRNLALEEFLIKEYTENIFMLWQNQECVVVGKHQNTLAEINFPYVQSHQIKVARRISGGGTVYHDKGNLNFTFILNGKAGKLVDFGRFTLQIVAFLNQLGVPAQCNARHDITINGLKISGNAEHIFKNRVLHHGTLLFNSDLNKLSNSIIGKTGQYTDKAVQSVRSKVCNILPFLKKKTSIRHFKNQLMEYIMHNYPGSIEHEINEFEIKAIQKISREKYEKWDWIYAYSPTYEFKVHPYPVDPALYFNITVKKGIITESEIMGKDTHNSCLEILNSELIGQKHHKESILTHLNEKLDLTELKGFNLTEFVNNLF